jgi:hypothetical protein
MEPVDPKTVRVFIDGAVNPKYRHHIMLTAPFDARMCWLAARRDKA